MKLVKEYKKAVAVAASLCAALAAQAAIETLTLTTGEVFTGETSTAPDGVVSVKTPYGTLAIPADKIAKKELTAADGATEIKIAEAEAKAEAAKEAEVAPEPVDKDPQWVEDYRNFVEENFPEGWQFRFRGGLEFRDTSSSTFSFYAAFDVKKEWDINIFTATAYYNYTSQTSAADVKDVTIDNYGVDTVYKRFFNDTKTWYVANLLNYKHDQVKNISHQVDEAVTFGYRFDIKRHNLTIDIGPGPAVRYVDSYTEGVSWIAMALVQEDLAWIISKTFRFEQNFNAALDLQDTDKYTATFQMALVSHLTKVMDLAIRYSYQYDNISSSTVKTEQRLIIAFEFPFNWQ